MIDVNTYIGRWPLPELQVHESRIAQILARHRISCAIVSSLNSIFAQESADHAWLKTQSPLLGRSGPAVPGAKISCAITLSPGIRNLSRALDEGRKQLAAIAVKLHPNYHRYRLSDPSARDLLLACGEAKLPVIIQLRIQDVRSQHPLMPVPDVDSNDALEAIAATPKTNFVLGGVKWSEASSKVKEIKSLPNVWLEISQCEVVEVLRRLINLYGAGKLLFGTHAPFFYVASALRKVKEARLSEGEHQWITHGNAARLFRID